MRRYFEDLRVDPRAPRRHGREVRRRRGHGRLRDPRLARGRRAARRPRRVGDAGRDRGARPRGADRRSTRARSSSAARARRSSPATPSTSPRGSSRRPRAARSSSAPRRGCSSATPSASSRSSRSRSRGSRSRSRRSGSSRCSSDAAPLARHPETPLVGRERERQRLWRDYEDAVADRTCRLFTLLGPAGIGKSRLVADFLERVGDSADVLRGRCLSYGEGITYWPLVEILDRDRRRARLGDRHVAARDAARVPPAARSARGRATAGRRHRRPAVGRAGVRRSRRARRRPLARRADLPPLRRAHRAPRRATRAGVAGS